jgi:hypothetical protein
VYPDGCINDVGDIVVWCATPGGDISKDVIDLSIRRSLRLFRMAGFKKKLPTVRLNTLKYEKIYVLMNKTNEKIWVSRFLENASG